MLERLNQAVWGSGLLVLLLGTGLYVSIRTGFFQLFGVRQILRHTIGQLRSKSPDRNAQWKTCTAALAAAMGTGNIVGVATALAVGGAGAIFWMWVSAFFGMMLTYAENVLAVQYRTENSTAVGALAYLQNGLRCKGLAGCYAVFCILASFGMGNMTQSSTAASALETGCHIPTIWTGVGLTGLLCCTVLGGMRTIGNVTKFLMPLLSGGYLLASVLVLWHNRSQLPDAWKQIFQAAWQPSAAGGGTLGTVMLVGLRHGVFSNEAGLGSSAMIHSYAKETVPGQQGMWSMVEVFFDTMVCCTLTALVLLSTGNAETGGIAAVLAAFSCVFGEKTACVLSWILALFAVATILGWCCCGELATRYLFGETGVHWYRRIYCLAAGIGAVVTLSTVWTLSDIANGLMAIPNLLGILLQFRSDGRVCTVRKTVRKFF
jgi:AGCS family alanine or glycine:cation symporter